MFFEDVNEVFYVFVTNVFDTKVVGDECEGDVAPFVSPESWRGFALFVAMLL